MRNKGIIQIILYINIALMGMMIANRILYLHLDDLGGGRYVQNAHPFNTDNNSNHKHSSEDMLMYLSLMTIYFFVFTAIVLKATRLIFKRKNEKLIYKTANVSIKLGRDPPFHFSYCY